jgi:hypothetical protein
MRRFKLYRDEDVSGVSGTGVVALGVTFPDGVCCMHWLGTLNSTVVYARLEHVLQIHGHNGRTRVEFIDQIGSTQMSELNDAIIRADEEQMEQILLHPIEDYVNR